MSIRQLFQFLFSACGVGTDGEAQAREAEAEELRQIQFTRELVLKKVQATFPNENPSSIMEILDRYGVKAYESHRADVQLAILKLSEGKLEKLEDYVKMAKLDFRDILVFAACPEGFRYKTWNMDARSAEEINRRDRKQYLDWLKGND